MVRESMAVESVELDRSSGSPAGGRLDWQRGGGGGHEHSTELRGFSGPGLGLPRQVGCTAGEASPGDLRRTQGMSQLMERAIREARQLPEADQEAIASIILQEIESERR